MRIPNVQNNNDNECTRNRWAATQIPSPRHDGCFFFGLQQIMPCKEKEVNVYQISVLETQDGPKKPLIFLYKSAQLVPKI